MTASHLKYTFHQPGDLRTRVLDVSYDPQVCITICNILRKSTSHKASLTSVSVACLPVEQRLCQHFQDKLPEISGFLIASHFLQANSTWRNYYLHIINIIDPVDLKH